MTKNRFLIGFCVATLLLALVRCIFPSIAHNTNDITDNEAATAPAQAASSGGVADSSADQLVAADDATGPSRFFNADGSEARHRIYSVPGYEVSFPDQNDVQLTAARKWGVKPVSDSAEAAQRIKELVYIGSNPYFYVDRLRNSIPYLVPRASVLLQDIGRNFFDSLQIKGIPLHKVIVTSVLRSKADVAKLRGKNRNATEHSCHLYGTTFDVCYNRYKTVQAPGEHRREVRNDTLKYVLAEVLRDMREKNRCYIKYEVHQGCWHITVR